MCVVTIYMNALDNLERVENASNSDLSSHFPRLPIDTRDVNQRSTVILSPP